jgi:cell wall-associated NlpC family hydrolase
MDPRTTPARPDLAAAFLQGKVEAARFVEGKAYAVARGRCSLQHAPARDAAQDSEVLHGEIFTVYEENNGWAWGQAARDSYVGYVHTIALSEMIEADYEVAALMTPVLPAPDAKRPLVDLLPMNARVKVLAHENSYARIAGNLCVRESHLRPLGEHAPDWVAVAERFLGAPYVWGGRTQAGLDCSGLIQTALQAGGIAAPRDTDMQMVLGAPVPVASDLSGLERGDLVFWKGHVGVMLDGARLLHANAFHMEVAIELMAEAAVRIAKSAGVVIAIKRL